MSKIYFVLFFLTFVSLLLRIYNLTDYPPSLFIDEYNVGLPGLEILKGISRPLWYGIGWYGTPAGSFYYFALIMKIFGTNEWGLRLAWAIPSALTVPFAFLFFRYVFGTFPALLGAIFLVFSPVHNHLSRWAHGAAIVSFLLFVALYLYELVKSQKKMIVQFLLSLFCGLVLAGMIYTYVGGRILVAAFFLYVISDYLIRIQNIKYRTKQLISIWQTGTILFIFLISIIPFLRYGLQHRVEFLARTEQVSLIKKNLSMNENMNSLITNMKLYSGMFFTTPDPNNRHIPYPGKPVFGLFFSSLFIIGLILYLIKSKRKTIPTTLLFLGIMSAGVLSNEAPSIFRTIGIIPLFYGLCGYGLCLLLSFISRFPYLYLSNSSHSRLRSGIHRNTWISVFTRMTLIIGYLILVIGGIIVLKEAIMFNHLVNNPTRIQYGAFTYKEGVIARKAAEESRKGKTVYLSPDFFWFSSVKFNRLAYSQHSDYRMYNIGDEITNNMRNSIAIVDSSYTSIYDYYQRVYPQVVITMSDKEKSSPYAIVDFGNTKNEEFSFSDIGLTVTWFTDPSKKTAIGMRIDPTVYYAWSAKDPVMMDVFYGEWKGTFIPPESGTYIYRGVADDYGGMELYDGENRIISPSMKPSYEYSLQMKEKPYRIQFMYQNTGGAKSYYVTIKRPTSHDFEIINPLWLKPDISRPVNPPSPR